MLQNDRDITLFTYTAAIDSIIITIDIVFALMERATWLLSN